MANRTGTDNTGKDEVDGTGLRRENTASGLSRDTSEGSRVQTEGREAGNDGQKAAQTLEKDKAGEDVPKKTSKLKELWAKVGLDMGTAMMMLKYVVRTFNGVSIAIYSTH